VFGAAAVAARGAGAVEEGVMLVAGERVAVDGGGGGYADGGVGEVGAAAGDAADAEGFGGGLMVGGATVGAKDAD
jgi:hypothetical protein